MAKAGFCAQCGSNVWLAEDGTCVNGHDASQISNVYEADQPEKDGFAQAADDVEDMASQAGDAMKGAWDNASPAAREAADAAGDAAKKAADAASAFGKKLFGGDTSEESGGAPSGNQGATPNKSGGTGGAD
jgi:hypothetical protein